MNTILKSMMDIREDKYKDYSLEDLVQEHQLYKYDPIYAEIFIKLYKIILQKVYKYSSQIRIEDCFSFAMESLYYSINTFKADKNYKFITYAVGNIERCFIREAARNNTQSRQIQFHTTFSLDYTNDDIPTYEVEDIKSTESFYEIDFKLMLNKLHLTDKEIFIIKSLLDGKKVSEIKRELNAMKLENLTVNKIFRELKRKLSLCPDFNYKIRYNNM